MFALLHMDRLVSQMMEGVMKQTNANTRQMFGANLTPENKVKLEKFQDQIMHLIETQMSWKALEPQYVELYAQTYTEDELDAILVFYKSPAGSSLLAKTPELTARSLQISQSRVAIIVPQLKQMVEDFIHDAAKSGAGDDHNSKK